MPVFVKICGICSRRDLEQISALRPDAVGFIQWPRSKRYVDPAEVGTWPTPSGLRRVGVFVDPTDAQVRQAVERGRFDVVQVHRFSPDRRIDRALLPEGEWWRALNEDEFGAAEDEPFDRYVVDSYDPATVGGTGHLCDWRQARGVVETSARPVLLAGGLTPGNVAAAIAAVGPWGVDVSSGVEIAPGIKDLDKVKAFITACRGI